MTLGKKILKIGQKMTNLQSFDVENGVKYFIYYEKQWFSD